MNTQQRWLRLNIQYAESEWLFNLKGNVRRLWPDILCYVKAFGNAGTCKMPSMKVLAKKLDTRAVDLNTLLKAAVADGALVVEGNLWTVVNWATYQDPDNTRVERQRRFRQKQKTANTLQVVDGAA